MKGDVTVRAECLLPERLVERALREGARFQALKKPDGRTLIARCDAASADTLLQLCRRFAVPAAVVSRRGSSAFRMWARRRRTLLAALVVFAAVCWLFLGRVWIVRVGFSGENAALGDPGDIRAALDEMGVRPGMSRRFDAGLLAEALRARCDGYSFVGARVQGVRLAIDAVPESPAPPLYDVEAARDLVSDRDGIVISAVARSGELCVQPGDAVRRGQLLIRGEELAAKDETRPIAALGEVIVRCWYEGEAVLPLSERRAAYTGRSEIAGSLRLFDREWPIVRADGYALQDVRVESLAIGGLFLPLRLERATYMEQRERLVQADPAKLRERLAALAFAEAAHRLCRDGPKDFGIARRWIDYEADDGTLRAHAVYEIHADAAVTRDALNGRWNAGDG